MNETIEQVMRECSEGSLNGSMAFPEVVSKLVAVGCEQYHTDLRRQEKTHYLPEGESYVIPLPIGAERIAGDFSADGVVAAIQASRRGEITYRQFLKRIIDAGCVRYLVFLSGKRALYLGRNGDMHIEHFPPS